MGKHGRHGKTEEETDFEAAEKGVEFDRQWQDSYDRAEGRKRNNEGAYYVPPVVR